MEQGSGWSKMAAVTPSSLTVTTSKIRCNFNELRTIGKGVDWKEVLLSMTLDTMSFAVVCPSKVHMLEVWSPMW
jgi:hypothetical protein